MSAGGGVPWSHWGVWAVPWSTEQFKVKVFSQKSPDLILWIKLEDFLRPPLHPSSCFLQLFCTEIQLSLKCVWKFMMALRGFLVTVLMRCHYLFNPSHLSSSQDVDQQVDLEASPCWELAGSLLSTGELWSGNFTRCVKMRFLQWGRFC